MLKLQWSRKIIIGLGVVLALLLCSDDRARLFAQISEPDSGTVDGEQILVLKNGEMLTGRIEQDTANLIVHVRQGSRLVISKKKAEFVCNSKSEAFWGKAARISASDVRQQVALFRWCLKHKLFDHAETQFNAVMNYEIPAVELESLYRQLTVLRTSEARKEQRRLAALQAKQQMSVPQLARSGTDPEEPKTFRRLPKRGEYEQVADRVHSSGVQQASFTSPLKPANRDEKSFAESSPSKTRSIGDGFSKVGAIPDLKRSHRLDSVVPVALDPYDASRFNAETVRRKTE